MNSTVNKRTTYTVLEYEDLERTNQALNMRLTNMQNDHYRELNHLVSLERAGKFYMVMQRAIKDNPALITLWSDFITYLMLCVPDLEEHVKNFKFQDFDPEDAKVNIEDMTNV